MVCCSVTLDCGCFLIAFAFVGLVLLCVVCDSMILDVCDKLCILDCCI